MNENAPKRPGRNDPCHCGSGKKYKKCHRDYDESLRPRERAVYIGHGEKYSGATISPTGEVLVHLLTGGKVKADHVLSVSEYEKAKGGKKTLNVVTDRFAPILPVHLAEAYDVVLAVDTNTRRIGEVDVSVGCIVEYYSMRVGEDKVEGAFRVNGLLAFRGCPPGEAERFSWWRVVEMLKGGPNYSDAVRVALITDHDQGKHEKYSRGEIPIYEDHRLPPNVTMMYASTDAGKEDLLNLLLDKADKQASVVLRQLAEEGEAEFEGRVIRLADLPDVRRKEPPASP